MELNGFLPLNYPCYPFLSGALTCVSSVLQYHLCFRIGKAGTLTLEQDPREAVLGSVTGKTRGTHTVLELNPLTAKMYVGGVPSDATVR